jgi:diguanylate cyclase (GGDEF)-like protein
MGDRLTGFLTRRQFDVLLRRSLEGNPDEGREVSLVMIDIDLFKHFNDRHGHEAGDAVIRRVAACIREQCTGGAVWGRYGGEEFAVLLPGVEREQAFLAAERIRSSMQETTRYPLGGETGAIEANVTVSAGVAALPTDGRDAGELLRKVDQALYRAKNTGRNKVCIAQEEKMATKTTHYTLTQLERLARLAKEENVGEAALLREALDDLLYKYRVSDVET